MKYDTEFLVFHVYVIGIFMIYNVFYKIHLDVLQIFN